jgi:hypothetical protein
MDHLTREQIQTLLRIEGESPYWFGVFDLYVTGFGTSIEVSIALKNASPNLNDRTVKIINELANLTENHYEHILRLLFDDAMIVKDDTSFGDPSPPPEIPPANWLRRLFWRPRRYRFVELAFDDPRHPLFGVNSPEDIQARIKWENFYVDDSQETLARIAFLTCYPPWEEEHGREIGIRNGVPVGINAIELNEYAYVQREHEEKIRIRVWSGFHSLSDVLIMIEDWDKSEPDREMLEAFARSEFQAKREAEATWPLVTDCVRLDEVFDSLNTIGVIALQNVGFTMSDGALANHDTGAVKGYCFYDEQDVALAVDGFGLGLAYGDMTDTQSGKREIGQLVKAELERRGFKVEWNGNPDTKLDLPQIVWQRRTPTDE